MKTTAETVPGLSPAQKRSLARRIFRGFKSIRFAIILMALIAAACLVGTLIPQEPYDPAKAIGRYGRVLGWLIKQLGLYHLYGTWWFVSLLALLAGSVATCAFSGMRLSLRKLYTLLAHASILLIVAGAIVRGIAAVDGTLTIEKGQTLDAFRVENGSMPLGFRLRLDDFAIRYYEAAHDSLQVRLEGTGQTSSIPIQIGKAVTVRPDGTSVEVLRRVPHFMIDGGRVYSASDRPLNPAIEVRLTGPAGESKRWLFAKFPEFHGHGSDPSGVALRYVWKPPAIKAFESHVTVLDEGGKEIRKAVILVNTPLKAGRYTLYQSSYDPETLSSSTLEVTYDPGVPLVFAGFILLPVGVALAFYAKPLSDRKGRSNA